MSYDASITSATVAVLLLFGVLCAAAILAAVSLIDESRAPRSPRGARAPRSTRRGTRPT